MQLSDLRLVKRPAPMPQDAVHCHSFDLARWRSLPFGAALGGGAILAYVVVGWIAVSHLFGGISFVQDNNTVGADSHSSSAAQSFGAQDAGLDSAVITPEVDGTPIVLIITVQGADESIDVPCTTTTARAPFDRITVTPDQVMDAFERWCTPGRPE